MFTTLLLSGFLSLSCAKDTSVRPPVQKAVAEKSPVNRTKLLQLVNKVRQEGCRCGDTYYNPAAPLTWNNELEKAAAVHSADMNEKRYFSHTASDGSRAGERMEKAGYKWTAFGENIGMGYKNEEEVVQAWKQSPSHCKNIMDQKFKEMGVARSGLYWTQTFGAR